VDEAKSDRPVGITEEAQRWFDDQSAIERYCDDRPDTFAGRWREGGGTSEVLAFTDDARQHVTDLSALLNDSSKVSIVHLPNTYRSLLELRDAIPGILGTTDGLAAWGPDVKANCVFVRALPEFVEDVRTTLTALYPDIRVDEGERPVAM
jgi:hypothetical protein